MIVGKWLGGRHYNTACCCFFAREYVNQRKLLPKGPVDRKSIR